MRNLKLILILLLGILMFVGLTNAVLRAKVKVNLVPPAPPGPLMESKNYEEPGCVARKGVPNLNSTFINNAPAWYVPLASKYFFYHWAEALINRSIGQSELNHLCLKWLFMAPTRPRGDYNVIVGGYRVAVTQKCKDTGFETETCEAPSGAPDYHKGADNVGTIVATDNHQWILMVRCIQKQYRDWAVFVTNPKHIDTNLFKSLAGDIKALGFDLKLTESAKYDTCVL